MTDPRETRAVVDSRSDSHVLLTIDDVREMRAQRDQAAQEAEKWNARVAELDGKLAAASHFLPPRLKEALLSGTSATDPHLQPSEDGRKWAPTVLRVLADTGHGLTMGQMRAALKNTPLAEEMGVWSNALYNALRKMILKGELVKRGEHYCLPDQRAPVANSEKKPSIAASLEDAILGLLKESHKGLTSSAIIEHLRSGEYAEPIRRNTTHVYNVLRRMQLRDKILKEDKLYRLPSKRTEPPSEAPKGPPQGSSEAGSRDGSRPSGELFPQPRVSQDAQTRGGEQAWPGEPPGHYRTAAE